MCIKYEHTLPYNKQVMTKLLQFYNVDFFLGILYFSPFQLLATLDDDLIRTRAADNQVKILSRRKADREGHADDVLANVMFRVLFARRFRRRVEAHLESVRKLLSVLLSLCWEEELLSCIITADWGYGKEVFMLLMCDFHVGSVFVSRSSYWGSIRLWGISSCPLSGGWGGSWEEWFCTEEYITIGGRNSIWGDQDSKTQAEATENQNTSAVSSFVMAMTVERSF